MANLLVIKLFPEEFEFDHLLVQAACAEPVVRVALPVAIVSYRPDFDTVYPVYHCKKATHIDEWTAEYKLNNFYCNWLAVTV